ncbi:MAG: hypothetical protein IKO75_00175 [Bacteroidales bacterium]|nr:hypothetical protein [Bacteroidales bacterium]
MKKELLYVVVGLVYISILFTLTKVGDLFPLWAGIILLVLYFVAIYIIETYVFSVPSVSDLETRIMLKMEKEGYKCKKEEGVLTYTLNGRRYDTYFWKVDKSVFRTMIVDCANIDDQWDKISLEGKAVLANYVNGECYHSLFHAKESCCCCSYTTFVRNPTDFINEARTGYDMICKAFNTAVEILPQIHHDYPANGQEGRIGFLKQENNNH